MQATALDELTPERILTGNQQHVPTTKAAKRVALFCKFWYSKLMKKKRQILLKGMEK